MTITADVAALIPNYKSAGERLFAQFGPAVLAAELGSPVVLMYYEAVTFNLPGNRYTPDFMAILEDGRLVFVEVKSSRYQRNIRDALSKLRAARAMHPGFVWVLCYATEKTGIEKLELVK